METPRPTVRSVLPPQCISVPQSASRHSHFVSIHCDALCESFLLAMSGLAGPIQMDLGVTPLVLRVSLGQAVALLKGRRACRTDLPVSNRASDGNHGQPE